MTIIFSLLCHLLKFPLRVSLVRAEFWKLTWSPKEMEKVVQPWYGL